MLGDRSEPEVLCDAASLIKLDAEARQNPDARSEVHEVLLELHEIGTPACLEAARRLARRFL